MANESNDTMNDAISDDWAQALEEQATASAAGDESAPEFETISAPASPGPTGNPMQDIQMVLDIPVQLSVELGRTKVPIKYILQLAQGSVVELDALAGEPMDVLING
jgi:flagellar motor switch protein FliN/FliY